jgi:ABC-type multidrug transport system fused ATPase/permease subunit
MSPLAVTVVTFSAWELGVPGFVAPSVVTSAKAFTAIATFRQLQEPVRAYPTVISTLIMALVSVRRLQRFLLSEELKADAVERRSDASPPHEAAVLVKAADFMWSAVDSTTSTEAVSKPTLTGIDLRVESGGTLAVCGTVGSGKSSLLAALLGQIPSTGGVMVAGRVAYVPQTAWIQNASLKDNVLFGRPYEEAAYRAALRTCALEADLPLLPAGDLTEIGERGVTLSGGQKQRVQLARALYADADVYLLDDPLSAVDAHTGTYGDSAQFALARRTRSLGHSAERSSAFASQART